MSPNPITMISFLGVLVFAIPVSLGIGGRVTSFGKDEDSFDRSGLGCIARKKIKR